MPVYDTPGVIIEEITSPGVIAGVGTSTAGFIGPAFNGTIAEPFRITSWEEFEERYGRAGAGPRNDVYMTDPLSYLAHAVAGFFANGGREAYICRVGVAARALRDVPAVGGGNALTIEAQQEGVGGDVITVQTALSSTVNGAVLALPIVPITSASGRRIVVDDASVFRVGDVVRRENANLAERLEVAEISLPTNEVFVTTDMTGVATGKLRLATLIPGTRRLRLEDAKGLFPGSVITIAQTTAGVSEPSAIVAGVVDDTVTLEKGIAQTFTMVDTDRVKITSHEFDLTIAGEPTYAGLSTSRRHPRYYEKAVTSALVRALPARSLPTGATPPGDLPSATVGPPQPLQRGADDDPFAIGAGQYRAGIDAFDDVDDVNFLAIPDAQDEVTQGALIDHCVRHGDRVAILDTPRGTDRTAALAHRAKVESERGFAALYHPWLLVPDPLSSSGDTMPVPPSGHVGGIYARVDENPGVHKAPANELVRGAVGLTELIGDAAQAPLNRAGVNTIRVFPGSARPVVWGARTTTKPGDTDWLYVNVRRLLCFIEKSIQEGLRQSVFRSQRPRAVAAIAAQHHRVPDRRLARRGAVRRDRRRGVQRADRRGDQPAAHARARPAVHRDAGRAGPARRVHRRAHRTVRRRGAGHRVRERASCQPPSASTRTRTSTSSSRSTGSRRPASRSAAGSTRRST